MRILFLLSPADQNFTAFIKGHAPRWLTGGKVLVNEKISYLSEIDILLAKFNCQAAITTDWKVLKILFPDKKFKDPDTNGQGLSVLDFQGNCLETKKGNKILITAPLRHLVTKKEAPFLFKHFIEKLGPDASAKFLTLPEPNIKYCLSSAEAEEAVSELNSEPFIAVDIETGKGQRITHISFASLKATYSFILSDFHDLVSIRKILANPSLKIFQNGKFDNLHLIHWNSPARNWYFDTYGMMACWYSELPRRLDFIGSFFLSNLLYWKDEDEKDKALYNAKDTHVTLWSFLAWMWQSPQWAKDNYAVKFPAVFPSISSEFNGLKIDPVKWSELTLYHRKEIESNLESLNACLGKKTFNPGSSKQVSSLIGLLAPKKKIDGADKLALSKFAAEHPLNTFLVDKILAYRKSLKLHSTYLDARLWKGQRLLYSIDPFGTETGRSSCSASSFYEMEGSKYSHYGTQIQNIPPAYKICIQADKDFLIVEIDKEQAESRATAYLSGSESMIDAVENSPDFHSHNASAFFGIPFDDLWDTENHKTKNKPIRDLSKRVNHGANYNMGAFVLITTMGEANVWKAKSLLGLNEKWGLKEIAEYLLAQFDATYPKLRNLEHGWYGDLIMEWLKNNGLIKTPDGWTRRFLGDPRKSKPALNELVAHSPQHLNAALVEKGLIKIWAKFEDPEKLRINGTIHDSLLFQVHKDHQYLIQQVKELWDATARITIHGREMFIPSAQDGPKGHWK